MFIPYTCGVVDKVGVGWDELSGWGGRGVIVQAGWGVVRDRGRDVCRAPSVGLALFSRAALRLLS